MIRMLEGVPETLGTGTMQSLSKKNRVVCREVDSTWFVQLPWSSLRDDLDPVADQHFIGFMKSSLKGEPRDFRESHVLV